MTDTTDTRSVHEIALNVARDTNAEVNTDEQGNTILTIGNYALVINDEPEGGHTYSIYHREDEGYPCSEPITTDGAPDNDNLEAFLTDWAMCHNASR